MISAGFLGAIGDFLFGSGGNDAEAFRGPGWEQQGVLLDDLAMGQFMTPEQLAEKRRMLDQFAQNTGGQSPEWLNDAYDRLGNMDTVQQNMLPRFTPGQAIEGQMTSNTSPLQQYTPEFQQRDPYQYSNLNFQNYDANKAVGDAYTPQFEMARRGLERYGQDERQGIAEDMNARGMLTTGGTTEAMMKQRETQGNRLADISSQLATQQGQQQLQSQQFGANLNTQQQGMQLGREQGQAQELFRQQGASDNQAQFLAQNALQNNSQQMQNQSQVFGQNMAGRQAALGEYAVQGQARQQPMNDLFRLYQLSAGSTPGNPATPGLIGSAMGGAGAAIGAVLCLPKGTKIETNDGAVDVENVKPGDEVVGGTVTATVRILRPTDHKFYRHNFTNGDVVMSKGHPYFDDLVGMEAVESDSDCTYDVKTSGGYYFVNGIKLGSTIGG